MKLEKEGWQNSNCSNSNDEWVKMAQTEVEEAPSKQLTPAQIERRKEKKELFEKERDEILDEIPASVKERFGQIYFSKWGGNFLPCLALSPFSVPPGPVRDMWYTMYDKVGSSR